MSSDFIFAEMDINYELKALLNESENKDELWHKFCSLWPLAKEDMDRTSDHWVWGIPTGPTRISHEEAQELAGMGVGIKIKPLPGAMLVKMQDRHKWESRAPITPNDLQDGRAVQIAIPDIGLLRINQVTVVEDYCTDALQELLDQGWRILAVCPPNAARRPDYILGRNKDDARD